MNRTEGLLSPKIPASASVTSFPWSLAGDGNTDRLVCFFAGVANDAVVVRLLLLWGVGLSQRREFNVDTASQYGQISVETHDDPFVDPEAASA
jgi:hypothetical protein